ncbi:hypothetical protein [Actinomadura sp. CNU-125]|uniref:hypothetical protein n=1 Tax=Actinomadura sp. CNU-125 TaxID=1904961 RepID=UPI001651BF9F|nr:hypothetical protein [Actinomadura sp. CNU-125]
MSVRVPAKVNLQLGVGPLRDDGYHDLVNVFHAVSLFDEVTAEPADDLRIAVEAAPGSRVAIDGVPTGDGNLAARAARLGRRRLGAAPRVALRIRKAIPVAGGMAGGSADTPPPRCRLRPPLGRPRRARPHPRDLLELAADLGSDVPFALLGGTAVGTGRGERLAPAAARGTFHWVFATADGGLSTPARLRRMRGSAPSEASTSRGRRRPGNRLRRRRN